MKSNGILWIRWIVANGFGEMIGLGAGFAAAVLLMSRMDPDASLASTWIFATVIVAFGTLEGVIVGWLQWWAAAPWLPGFSRRAWVTATAAGAFVAWVLGMLPSTLLFSGGGDASPAAMEDWMVYLIASGMGLVLGLVLALPQWLVLRRWVRGAIRWLPANMLAWAAGMPIVFVGAGSVEPGTDPLSLALRVLLILLVSGVVVGTVHGYFLTVMLGRHKPLPV